MSLTHRPTLENSRSPCSPAGVAPCPRPWLSPSRGPSPPDPALSPCRPGHHSPRRTPAFPARARSPCPEDRARRSSASPSRSPSLHQLRTLEVAHPGLRQDTEALGNLLIRLLHLAHVLAEPVLVHLLVGPAVPQAAIVRADLVGQDDP